MEKVQQHLQRRLPAKMPSGKPCPAWSGQDPPVMERQAAVSGAGSGAVRAGTCRVGAGARLPPRAKGCRRAAWSWQACEEEGERVRCRKRVWGCVLGAAVALGGGCRERFCTSHFPRSQQSQGWEVTPSVSNSMKLFALEMSQSWDLASRENTALVKETAVHAACCSCGEGACLHLH